MDPAAAFSLHDKSCKSQLGLYSSYIDYPETWNKMGYKTLSNNFQFLKTLCRGVLGTHLVTKFAVTGDYADLRAEQKCCMGI